MELPPRTRRIRTGRQQAVGAVGTTSAHAENTHTTGGKPQRDWNYLRARGEYSMVYAAEELARELPPRTRRIRKSHSLRSGLKGTTSAHAENTYYPAKP